MTFYKLSSSSKAQAAVLCATRLELSPWPSLATVATWWHRFRVDEACRLGLAGPQYIADICNSF